VANLLDSYVMLIKPVVRRIASDGVKLQTKSVVKMKP
jgi:hypothetical protein